MSVIGNFCWIKIDITLMESDLNVMFLLTRFSYKMLIFFDEVIIILKKKILQFTLKQMIYAV